MIFEHQVYTGIAERAWAIAPHLPPGPFSKGRFVDHATGLNALDNAGDVDAILDYLTIAGVITTVSPGVALWIRAYPPDPGGSG